VLEILTRGFRDVRQYLHGMRTLSEENLGEVLKMIRVSLLEADVELQVTRAFLERVKEKALGELVLTRVSHKDKRLKVAPGDHFIKLCHDELIQLMGPVDSDLRLKTRPVSSIMMVGLQGSGKTTTAAKLARFLIKKGKKPMLAAADVYRPAAVDQLQKLGRDLDIPVHAELGADPPKICEDAVKEASAMGRNVVILDTAGRLTVDEPLMAELEQIKQRTRPDDVLLVCDSMIGQESVNVAKAFNERLKLTGFILTKLDGDARGGAAISIKEATGVPIKFLGMGEALDRLEEFRPEGLASRILGFGDVVGLVKDFEEVVDEKKAEEDALRMLQGKFDLEDFLGQIRTIKRMGPLQDVVEKIPFLGGANAAQGKIDDYELVRIESMINSMTPQERKTPQIIDPARMKRIARGAGRGESEVRDLLGKFRMMRDLLGAVGGQKPKGPFKRLKRLGNFFGLGGPESASGPAVPGAPFGLPEAGRGRMVSARDASRNKKRRKIEKQARKKARKK
jgi:signal recognition particle subunit SRP54